MSEYNGSQAILKVSNEEGIFETIFGFSSVLIEINNKLIEKSNIFSGHWIDIANKGGQSSLLIEGKGVFTNSKVEKQIKLLAFLRQKKKYQIIFPNNDLVEADFIISKYKSFSESNDLQAIDIKLFNSGAVTFTPS